VDEQPTLKLAAVPEPVSRAAAAFETGLIVAGLLALLVLLPHGVYADGIPRFNALSQLLETGTLSTTKYSMIGPLFSAPLWFLGNVYRDSMWWCARYSWCIFSLGILALYLLLRNRLDRRLLRFFLILLIFASMFPNHLQWYYGEVFTAMCVGVGLVAALYGPALGGWVLVVLGVANTPVTLVGLAFVVAKRMLDTKQLRYVLVLAAAAALIVGEDWLRRGSPLTSNYEPGFTYPIFFGLLSVLLSLNEGIIFFAPGILLPVRQRILTWAHGDKYEMFTIYVLWMLFLGGMILVYAHWYDWSGAWFWGPRFFLFASIPASFVVAVRLCARDSSLPANVLTLLVLCLSFWVGLNGAIFSTKTLDHPVLGYYCPQTHTFIDDVCFYAPELGVLWQPFVVASGYHWQLQPFLSAEFIGWKELLYACLTLVAFIYLATPLVLRMARPVSHYLKVFAGEYLRPASWRL
jgi:hypothetical protein